MGTSHQSHLLWSPQAIWRGHNLTYCFLIDPYSTKVARSLTFGHNLWPHHCPSDLFVYFCHMKSIRSITDILGDTSCCLLTLLMLSLRQPGNKTFSAHVLKKAHNMGGPMETEGILLGLTRKGARKVFTGKNLEENTGESAETVLLTDCVAMQHPMRSLSTCSQASHLEEAWLQPAPGT